MTKCTCYCMIMYIICAFGSFNKRKKKVMYHSEFMNLSDHSNVNYCNTCWHTGMLWRRDRNSQLQWLLGTHNWTSTFTMFVFVKTPWKFTLQYSFQTLYMVSLLTQTLYKLNSIHSDEKLQLNIPVKIKLHSCRITWLCPTEFWNSGHSHLGYKTMQSCTRWFKYDRDWFVCKQAALRSSCATFREWSHNLHPPSCSG